MFGVRIVARLDQPEINNPVSYPRMRAASSDGESRSRQSIASMSMVITISQIRKTRSEIR